MPRATSGGRVWSPAVFPADDRIRRGAELEPAFASATKESHGTCVWRTAGRSLAGWLLPCFPDGTGVVQTRRRCRIAWRAAASPRVPPGRHCRSGRYRGRPLSNARIHAKDEPAARPRAGLTVARLPMQTVVSGVERVAVASRLEQARPDRQLGRLHSGESGCVAPCFPRALRGSHRRGSSLGVPESEAGRARLCLARGRALRR